MPIIKANNKMEKEQVRISIEKSTFEKIKPYCEWANVKKYYDFFAQAVEFVLSKDKEWLKKENEKTRLKV
jgi:hypothetical protein